MGSKKHEPTRAVHSSKLGPHTHRPLPPANVPAMDHVLNAQRVQLFKAEALAMCLGRLLHELYTPEKGEPDLAYVVDTLRDLSTGVVTSLDPSNFR